MNHQDPDPFHTYLDIIDEEVEDELVEDEMLFYSPQDALMPSLEDLFEYKYWVKEEDSLEIWNIPNEAFWDKWARWKLDFKTMGIEPHKFPGQWIVYMTNPSYFYLVDIEK